MDPWIRQEIEWFNLCQTAIPSGVPPEEGSPREWSVNTISMWRIMQEVQRLAAKRNAQKTGGGSAGQAEAEAHRKKLEADILRGANVRGKIGR